MTADLVGLRVVIDVQHLFRDHKPRDRGAVYTLPSGALMAEADATLVYAAAAAEALTARGAAILTNDPKHGILVGYYSTRNRLAGTWGGHAYLACHLNAGRGSYAMVECMASLVNDEPARLSRTIASYLWHVSPEILSTKVKRLVATERGAACIEACPSKVAAVLLEPFFGDNPAHQPLLAATELRRVGIAIANGVANWWLTRTPQA